MPYRSSASRTKNLKTYNNKIMYSEYSRGRKPIWEMTSDRYGLLLGPNFKYVTKILGRGVFDVAAQHHRQVNSLCYYFDSKKQPRPLHATALQAVCWLTSLNLRHRSFNPRGGVKSNRKQCLVVTPFIDLHLSIHWGALVVLGSSSLRRRDLCGHSGSEKWS